MVGRSLLLRAARRGERGVALVLTLLVLSVLVVVVAQLSFSTKLDVKIASNYRADVQNQYAVRAGVAYAKLFLKQDFEVAPDVDSLQETWAKTFEPIMVGDVELMLWIEDEDRKFNLNSLIDPRGAVNTRGKDQYTKLLKVLRIGDNTLVPRLVDYLDKDTEGLFEHNAKNNFLYTAREVRRLEGYTDDVLFGDLETQSSPLGLLPLVTTWSTGQVNVNTASIEVLECIHADMTRDAAEAIVHWRTAGSSTGKANVFQTLPGDLNKVPGLKSDLTKKIAPLLTVKSSVFLAHLRARRGSLERRMQAVLRREEGIVKTVAIFQDQTYRNTGILNEDGEKEP